ncbi:MAG: DUF6794 domain-containing protein [Bacteroidota bacterium]
MKQVLLGLIVLLPFGTLFGQEKLSKEEQFQKEYEKRIKKERLYGVYIPRDVPDALTQLNKLTPREAKATFKSVEETTAVKKLHFSLGRWIIHNWGFYKGSRLSHHLKEIGVSHPDDQARVIITAYHRYLNKKPLKVKETAEYYTEKRRKEWEAKRKKGTVLSKQVRKKEN